MKPAQSNKDKVYISKNRFKLATQQTIRNFLMVCGIALLASSVIGLIVLVNNRGQQTSVANPALAAPFNPGLELFVSTTGNDSNNGRSSSSAFRTIEKARTEVRTIRSSGIPNGGIAVNIAGGIYDDIQIAFDSNDSGTSTSPIVYRAQAGQQVRLVAAKRIPISSFSGGSIKQASLSNVGFQNVQPLGARGSGYDGQAPAELYFNGKRMTIAQYPNDPVWAYTTGSPYEITAGYATYKCGESTFDCNVINNLSGTGGLFIHAWNHDYASFYEPVSINAGSKTLSAQGDWIEMAGERRFRLLNARSLLDVAGEYYIDRGSNILYFYPPENLTNQEIYLSSKESVFKFNNASNIRLERLTMEDAYGHLVDIKQGSNVQVLGSTLKNSGENAVFIQGGADHLIQSNNMYELGEGGVIVLKDSSSNMESARILVLNNHIYKFGEVQMTYRQAVRFVGNNNRAAYNKIHDAPNMAIWMQGSNNILEYNDVFDVVRESGDTAPFHTALRSGTSGNEVRYNYFHDVDPNQFRNTRGQTPCEGTTGVYLDDVTTNFRVYGNIIANPGVRGVFINNGNNNRIENNIFLNSQYGVYLQYRYWTEPAPPKGNVIQNNVNYNVQVPLTPPNRSTECPNASYQTNMFSDNTISNANGGILLSSDPGIIDPSTKQLRSGISSSIQSALPGFQRIPVECIGNYNDEYRTDANRNSACGESTRATPIATPIRTQSPVPSPFSSGLVPLPPPPTGSTPYRTLSVPGIIQAEHFDNGGQGVAYNDTTPGSQLSGVDFRTDTDVDIERLPVTILSPTVETNLYNIAWTVAGEYLKYTVNVSTSGQYVIKSRVASAGPGGSFSLQIDSAAQSAALTVPDTGGWQTYTDVNSNPMSLTAGTHVLTVRMVSNGTQPNANAAVGNFDSFNVQAATAVNKLPVGTLNSVVSPTYNSIRVVSDSIIDPDSALATVAVKIYDNNLVVRSLRANTLNETFTNISAGSHVIKVTATDNQTGQEVELTGSPKTVSVQSPPTPAPTVSPTQSPKPTIAATQAPIPTRSPTPTVAPPISNNMVIYAAGKQAANVWPQLGITILSDTNGDIVTINKSYLSTYEYKPRQDRPIKDFKFNFINDYSGNGEDRNIRIQKVVYKGTEYKTADSATYSSGSWTLSNGCSTRGYIRSEWLHCQWGHFKFDQK